MRTERGDNIAHLVRIPILAYHSISDEPASWMVPWNVTPRTFRSHLDAIVDSGCTPLTVSQLVDALRRDETLPRRPVVVTFDDGFADLAGVAGEAMHERGIVGTAYLSTGSLRGARPIESMLPPARMLEWSQLAEVEALGLEIGAHSHSHPELDTLRPNRAWEEVILPKALLEEALEHPVRSFAYPHGYANSRVRDYVAAAGYDSACQVRNAFSSPFDNLYGLARLTLRSTTEFARLRRWLVGEGAPLAGAHEGVRTHLWRRARHLRRRLHGPEDRSGTLDSIT